MEWPSQHGILVAEQVKLLIGSLRMQDPAGRLLGIQLDWLQLKAGTETPFLEDGRKLPFLPGGWIIELQKKLKNLLRR